MPGHQGLLYRMVFDMQEGLISGVAIVRSLTARTGLGLLRMCWELGSKGVAWNWWDISRPRWLIVLAMWDAVLVRVLLSEHC